MSVTDTVTFNDYITVISLGISVVSIVVVMYLQSKLRKVLVSQKNQTEPLEDDTVFEVSAIVSEFSSRLKRLEEGLVDLKVKQEIMDLRVARSTANPFRAEVKPQIASRNENIYVPVETSVPR